MPSYHRRVEIAGRSSQELYEVVSAGIDRLLSQASLGSYQIERLADQRELKIKSHLFSAKLVCTDDQIELNAQLSLLALPFKAKFDEGITRWLSKTFSLDRVS